jgi:hypothetical protein
MKREKYGRYPVECVGGRRTITTKSISHGICLKKGKKKGLQIGKENSQFGLESFISITQIVRVWNRGNVYTCKVPFFVCYYFNICLSDGKQLTIREKQVRLSISVSGETERTSFMVDCVRAPRIEKLRGKIIFSLSYSLKKSILFLPFRFCRDEKVQRKETRHATLSKASDGMRTRRSNGEKRKNKKEVLLPPFNANMQVDKLFSFLSLLFLCICLMPIRPYTC